MSRASRLPALGVGPNSLATTLPSSHLEGPLWPLLEAEIESHLALVQQELDRLIGDIRNVLGFEATEKTSANDVTAFDPTTVADLPGLLKVLKAE